MKIAIIDGGYFYKMAAIMGEDINVEDPRHQKEIETSINHKMKKLLNEKEFTHFIGFLDGGKNFRYYVYPDYKANRKDKEKPLALEYIQNYLIEKFKFIKVTGIEADDAVTITHKNYVDRYTKDTYIISADKDLRQKPGKHIHIDYQNNLLDMEITEEIGIQFLLSQLVIGDSSDNIKGIEGKGKAYFNKLADIISYSDDDMNTRLAYEIFREYMRKYGIRDGLKRFSENFLSLYLMEEEKRNFVTPEPYQINRKQ